MFVAKEHFKNVTNMILLNLALADIIISVGQALIVTRMVIDYFYDSSLTPGENSNTINALCRISSPMSSISIMASNWITATLGVARYIAICRPFAVRRYPMFLLAKWTCAVIWACSIVIMTPSIMWSEAGVKNLNAYSDCKVHWRGYIWWEVVWMVTPPLVIILVTYSLIIKALAKPRPRSSSTDSQKTVVSRVNTLSVATTRRDSISMSTTEPIAVTNESLFGTDGNVLSKLKSVSSTTSTSSQLQSRKVSILALVIITVYLALNLPFYVYDPYVELVRPSGESPTFTEALAMKLTVCLSHSHAAVNPIMYSFLTRSFRTTLRKTLTSKWF